MLHKAEAGLTPTSCPTTLERPVNSAKAIYCFGSAALCSIRPLHAMSLKPCTPAQEDEGVHSPAPAASKAGSKANTDTTFTKLDCMPDAPAPVVPAMGDQPAALAAATFGAQQVSSAPPATPSVQCLLFACLHCPVAGSDPQSLQFIA